MIVSTTPYTSQHNPDEKLYFRSSLFLNTAQSLTSALAAIIYLIIRKSPQQTFKQSLGMNNSGMECKMLKGIARVAVLQAVAQVLGFTSLKHISYPTMVLAKSCKLVPVSFYFVSKKLLLNEYSFKGYVNECFNIQKEVCSL